MLAKRLEQRDHAEDRRPDEVPGPAGGHRLHHPLILLRRNIGVHADNAGTELPHKNTKWVTLMIFISHIFVQFDTTCVDIR